MRHKLIRSRKYPTKRVELCPNCNSELRKFYEQISGLVGKKCIKCGFKMLPKEFRQEDFMVYGNE